jgi:signal transduction histidine kinase
MLLLEQHAIASTAGSKLPHIVDILVPKLGEVLLSKGLLTEDQLRHALDHQRLKNAQGQSQMLGQTLIELNMITHENLDNVIMVQVLELQAALQSANQELEKRVMERTAEVESALSKLNDVNQLKNNFVSNVSHELRTPLSQIKGYVNLLAEKTLGELNTEQTDAVHSALQAVHRLEKLIEDLIRLASAARGELVLDISSFCISDLATSVISRAMSKAQKANVNLTSRIPSEPVFTEGDSEKINWIITQLIDNAIKFTPEGKNVTLTIEVDKLNSRVFTSISDSGIGIPFTRLPELFHTFHQLDGSATRRYGGTGLGLALVYRILEAHRTQIKVESAPGHGSVFSFDLPLAHMS